VGCEGSVPDPVYNYSSDMELGKTWVMLHNISLLEYLKIENLKN